MLLHCTSNSRLNAAISGKKNVAATKKYTEKVLFPLLQYVNLVNVNQKAQFGTHRK